MEVRVKFYSLFERLAGTHYTRFRLDEGSTLANALDVIALRYGSEMREAIFGAGREIKESCAVLVNGAGIDRASVGSLTLHDGNEIWLLPPLSGG